MPRLSAAFWVIIVLASACAGALYGLMLDNDNALVRGAIFGICIGTLATMHERGLLFASARATVRRLPAPLYFLAAEIILLLVVLLAMVIAGVLCWSAGIGTETLRQSITPTGPAVAYSLLVCAVFIFVLRMRDLIGSEIFANLMLGRYHRPVSEQRAFLFLDLVGSTAYAERHGDLAAQELLKEVFAVIAEPVRRHGGQIDDYIGDEVIISWPFARGTKTAKCVACVFAIHGVLQRDRDRWIRRFGIVPELRAALHGGSVVTAEVGVDRHKIAYFGDVLNATARLEQLCRETGSAVLISGELLEHMPALPPGIVSMPIGEHPLRGRRKSMFVHALRDTENASSAASKAAA